MNACPTYAVNAPARPGAFQASAGTRALLRAAIARRIAMGRPPLLIVPTTAAERAASPDGDPFIFLPDPFQPADTSRTPWLGEGPSIARRLESGRGGMDSEEHPDFHGLRRTSPWPVGAPLPRAALPGGERWPAGERPPAWWRHAAPPLWRLGDSGRYVLTRGRLRFFGLFTRTSKMSCGSWSTPAGAVAIGGTCPSAAAMLDALAQRTPAAHQKIKRALEAGVLRLLPGFGGIRQKGLVREPITRPVTDPHTGEVVGQETSERLVPDSAFICDFCYAGKGNFRNISNQLGQLLRWLWTWEFFAPEPGTGKARREKEREKRGAWVALMVGALLRYLVENASLRAAEAQSPRYFRIHDSGDFATPAYLEAWADIAGHFDGRGSRPYVAFWAPTRVWNIAGFHAAFRYAAQVAPNLTLRPSAMNFGDPPPVLPFAAAGSSAGRVESDTAGGPVWVCPAYAGDGHTCQNARAPDCQPECRFCWGGRVSETGPVGEDLRERAVTYAAH